MPLIYIGAGHAALAAAFVVPAVQPGSIAGFFYHPRMFAVVHLVTLGWITTAILGATYIVGPLALRMPLRTNWLDRTACALTLFGAAGVVSHFGLETYSGVMWSGYLLLLGVLIVAARVFVSLRTAKSPREVRVHVGFAYFNLLLAALLGVLVAWNKRHPFLPGNHLQAVFGHVHLALAGWAALMVVGVGYRLFAMYLPAIPLQGPRVWASALLLEAGVLGLAAAFLFDPGWAGRASVVLAAGFGVFLVNVVSMLRNPVPAARKLVRPDIGMVHALQALLYLLASVVLGLVLVLTDEWREQWIMVYGVFAIVGFLAQAVLGVEMRLLPMFAWTEAWAGSDYKRLPTSPHVMPARPLQWAALVSWTAGVPALAYGLYATALPWVSAGAWLLLAGTVVAGINTVRVLRHAFPPRAPVQSPAGGEAK